MRFETNDKKIKNKIPELLAPVGGSKQLTAAVENGADAVYLGGRFFNARQNAENFDDYNLRKALEYAHIRGVNVYITLNTIISDFEMQQALEYANTVYEAGADAIIVQDIGFAGRVKKQLPDLPLHLSTQGTVYNSEGVRIAERLGFSRVVLSRELTITEIKDIVKKTGLELEVFAHGALCQCYSGQCFMSSMIGGRSGNRGTCAQPCRLPYSLRIAGNGTDKTSDSGYYLSPKDLCTIEHLNQIVESGVKSLKIEGRLKSPEYVAIVTGLYRKYLELYAEKNSFLSIDPADMKDLKQIFNRGGFSTGYFFSRPGRDLITRERAKHWGTYLGKVVGRDSGKRFVDILLEDELSMGDGIEIVNENLPGNIVTMMQINRKKTANGKKGDIIKVGYIEGSIKKGDSVYKISDKALNKRAQETFSGKIFRRVHITGNFKAVLNEPMTLTVKDKDGNEVSVKSDYKTETAVNKPMYEETARTQINKTGSTPYIFDECNIEIAGDLSVPLSELNLIRRKALEELTILRSDRYPDRKPQPVQITDSYSKIASDPVLSVYLYKWANKEFIDNINADRVYLPFINSFDKGHLGIITGLKERGIQVMLSVPPITRGAEDRILKEQVSEVLNIGIDGVLIGNTGHIEILADSGLPVFGDYSLNIYNSLSVKAAAELGLKGITLSHELSLTEIKKIRNCGIETEATVYGRIPVMISEHCPIGSEISKRPDSIKCGLCERGRYCLKDRTGAEFPVTGDPLSCRSTILNCSKICVPEFTEEMFSSGVTTFRLYFDDEDKNEVQSIISLFRSALSGQKIYYPGNKYTKGHYTRGVSNMVL